MIAKSYIQDNLNRIDTLYRKSTTTKAELFFSKLALLELCGWIEESMDDVIRCCAARTLKDAANHSYLEEKVLTRTYGFLYKKHFRSMLIQLLGLITVEKLEANLDRAKFDVMRSTLGTLKSSRDSEAHTHIKGVTRVIDAPSLTKSRFSNVYDGLKNIESELRKMKL